MRPIASSLWSTLDRQLARSFSRSCGTAAPATAGTCSASAAPLRRRLVVPGGTLNNNSRSYSSKAAFRWRSAENHPCRSYSSAPPPPPPPKGNTVKFWPFVLVIALGSGGYVLLANRRKGTMPHTSSADGAGQLPAPPKSTPAFSGDDVTVVFVLGGPGAGKGTQCARLVKEYGFSHLSAGDLLRAEQERPGSEFGDLIRDCIKNGTIVPMEVTVQLLENAMAEGVASGEDKKTGKAKFLIDGFPRKMDQAFAFEEKVCPARFVLFYDCPEAEMERRLLERGKTSGRSDDNAESIKKRFRTFVETSMPVVDHYEKEGRVVKINATATPDAVYKETQARLADRLGQEL